jgi:TRAP-type transport system periplasmic protein
MKLDSFKVCLVLMGSCLSGAYQAAQAQVTLSISTEYPETAMPGEGLNAFAKAVRTLSAGKLIFTTSFDAKAGYKSADMLNAVASRTLDAGDAYLPALSAADPIFSLSALPFVVNSIDGARSLMAASQKAYQEVLGKAGVRWLYSTPWPASGIWSKDLLQNASDLTALRIRTYDSVSQAVMSPLTSSAMNVSFADVMPMLKDGRATAVLSSGDGGAGRKLWDFLPHFTEINYAIPISATFINSVIYESLSPEMQDIIMQAAAQTEIAQWNRIRGRLDDNYARMRSNGVTINTVPNIQLKFQLTQAALPVIADWKKKVASDVSLLVEQVKD